MLILFRYDQLAWPKIARIKETLNNQYVIEEFYSNIILENSDVKVGSITLMVGIVLKCEVSLFS